MELKWSLALCLCHLSGHSQVSTFLSLARHLPKALGETQPVNNEAQDMLDTFKPQRKKPVGTHHLPWQAPLCTLSFPGHCFPLQQQSTALAEPEGCSGLRAALRAAALPGRIKPCSAYLFTAERKELLKHCEEEEGGAWGVHVCGRGGRQPTAPLPSGILTCQPESSDGSRGSSACLSCTQPVLQPEEMGFYLSAFEMHT